MRSAPALYLISDRAASDRPLPEALAAALSQVDASRVAVQLREKDLRPRELFELGKKALEACRTRGARLLVNDRLDVAMALGADGVHLGGGSMSAADARRVWPGALVAVSCHSVEELAERAPGADFAVWGPVFATPSKARYGPPVGTSRLPAALSAGVPLVALGGVDAGNAGSLKSHGFQGVACIRAVFSAQDPGAAAAKLLLAFDAA